MSTDVSELPGGSEPSKAFSHDDISQLGAPAHRGPQHLLNQRRKAGPRGQGGPGSRRFRRTVKGDG